MTTNVSIDLTALLQVAQKSLRNHQEQHAAWLIEIASDLVRRTQISPASLEIAVGLDRGLRRTNEDCLFCLYGALPSREPFGFFLVADGMGGHLHGQEAAHLAIERVVEHMLPSLLSTTPPSTSWSDLLLEGCALANAAIYYRNLQSCSQATAQMGTTLTGALIVGTIACIVNVGDSRTYLYREGEGLSKITKDHSIVASLIASGEITEEQSYTHSERNKILRCLGATSQVEVDLFQQSLKGGDMLLLCSDGLWEMVRDSHIEQILSSSSCGAWSAFCMKNLLSRSLQGGGTDNIGGILVRFPPLDVSAMGDSI